MRTSLLLSLALAALVGGGTWAQKARPRVREEPLPEIGTRLAVLPPGPGKAIVEEHCLKCHSADILHQQRLTEKQWAANVTKMVGWGAEVPEADRAALVTYLAQSFGPGNRFEPVVTRPLATR